MGRIFLSLEGQSAASLEGHVLVGSVSDPVEVEWPYCAPENKPAPQSSCMTRWCQPCSAQPCEALLPIFHSWPYMSSQSSMWEVIWTLVKTSGGIESSCSQALSHQTLQFHWLWCLTSCQGQGPWLVLGHKRPWELLVLGLPLYCHRRDSRARRESRKWGGPLGLHLWGNLQHPQPLLCASTLTACGGTRTEATGQLTLLHSLVKKSVVPTAV